MPCFMKCGGMALLHAWVQVSRSVFIQNEDGVVGSPIVYDKRVPSRVFFTVFIRPRAAQRNILFCFIANDLRRISIFTIIST